MDEHIYKDRFKVTQHSVENIKIIEIRELFHLIKFKVYKDRKKVLSS